MAQSYWRKSGFWWGMMISLLLSGTAIVLRAGSRQGHWAVELLLALFAVVAYGLALIAGFMVARTWVLHRRADRTQ